MRLLEAIFCGRFRIDQGTTGMAIESILCSILKLEIDCTARLILFGLKIMTLVLVAMDSRIKCKILSGADLTETFPQEQHSKIC